MRGKQSDPVRNEQKMEVLREEKQLRFCLWMDRKPEVRERGVRECFNSLWKESNVRGRDGSGFFAIVKPTVVECACG